MKSSPISTGSEWTFELLARYESAIAHIAKEEFKLDTYPNQIEVISAEQMLDAYASAGMPLGYHHWSFGKNFVNSEKSYRRGQMGLAYELVINSNPCIAYLLEENSMCMQALVIAHACFGHNSFFKNNYLFKQWTNADTIIDYLIFAKQYIKECERKHGIDKVEETLDACHALMNYGVDRHTRPAPVTLQKKRMRQNIRDQYVAAQENDLWRTIPSQDTPNRFPKAERYPADMEENILYFIEKNAPALDDWQREIIRIVRKMAQYFYPQRQTKVMNEGWATYWHYKIMYAMYDRKLVTDEFMLEFIQNHTNATAQVAFDSPRFNGFNPYSLGLKLFQEIERICRYPSEEDKRYYPDMANSDWLQTLDFSMRNFKDESFIAQYLSPNLIRELKLFCLVDNPQNPKLEVSAIHNDAGYQEIRKCLAAQYDITLTEPDIQVYNVDVDGDRTLILRHIQRDGIPLHDSSERLLEYLYQLWKFPVTLETISEHGDILSKKHYPKASLSPQT